MTTTLPATIPGLLRRCSPCFYQPDEGYPIGTPPIKVIVMGRDDAPPEKRAGEWICNGVDEALWLDYLEAWGLDRSTPESRLSLDLTDPTGFDHAARYVAETICKKAGWPAPVSVMACHQRGLLVGLWLSLAFEGTTDARQIFCFTRENGGDRLMDKQFCGGIPTYCTTVVDVAKVETAVEALRLAVLAVAGVQV
jgi:hypothetical protein